MFGVGSSRQGRRSGRRRSVGRVGVGDIPDVAGVHGGRGRSEVRQGGQG